MLAVGVNVNYALVREGAASLYFFRGDRGRYARDLLDAVDEGMRLLARLLGRLPAGRLDTPSDRSPGLPEPGELGVHVRAQAADRVVRRTTR